MNTVLIGQKWLAQEALKLLINRGETVSLVITSKQDRLYSSALAAGVKARAAEKVVKADMIPECTELIVAAHNHLYVAADAIKKARIGALAYHPSLLPLHRGKDALRWSIRMGERVTGGSVYWMTDKVDAGGIAAQEFCFIRPGDDAATLWRRDLAPLGIKLFNRVLDDITRGRLICHEQDESLATWEPSLDVDPLGGRIV